MRKYLNNILISGFALILPLTGSYGILTQTNDIVYQNEVKEPVSSSQVANTELENPLVADIPQELLKQIPKPLFEVAKCESFGGQHKWEIIPDWVKDKYGVEKGDLVEGLWSKADKGLYQINTYAHKETLERLNLDVTKLEDNIEFALYLYEQSGRQPWYKSEKCWSK